MQTIIGVWILILFGMFFGYYLEGFYFLVSSSQFSELPVHAYIFRSIIIYSKTFLNRPSTGPILRGPIKEVVGLWSFSFSPGTLFSKYLSFGFGEC